MWYFILAFYDNAHFIFLKTKSILTIPENPTHVFPVFFGGELSKKEFWQNPDSTHTGVCDPRQYAYRCMRPQTVRMNTGVWVHVSFRCKCLMSIGAAEASNIFQFEFAFKKTSLFKPYLNSTLILRRIVFCFVYWIVITISVLHDNK